MKRVLCGLVVLGLFLGALGQARSDFIYWSGGPSGQILRANIDGTGQPTPLVSGLAGPLGPALDLAGGQMYWGETFGEFIRRTNLDGSERTDLIGGLINPGRPALDLAGGKMYFNLKGPGEIRRANLDGTGMECFITGLTGPSSVTLDLAAGKIYWAESSISLIQRANLDGSGIEPVVTTGVFGTNSLIALDIARGKLYWTNMDANGDIRRANLDGTGQEILVSNLKSPTGIALDVSRGLMYWTDYAGGDIRRANLDGSGQEILITTPSPALLALDLGAPGTAVFFAVAASASVAPSTPFDVTITALDPYGNVDVNYQGTVTFSTSDADPGIVLPADYTFTAADAGVHTFPGGVTLITPGDQTVTTTDTASGITGGIIVTVGP